MATLHDRIMAYHAVNAAAEAIICPRGNVIPHEERDEATKKLVRRAEEALAADIYEQHRAAFSRVSAYVVTKAGERIASVAFKFPADGAGRLYCYFHIFGARMVRGFAGGYGYDKKSAAAESAVSRIADADYPEASAHVAVIKNCLATDSGYDWDRRVRDAGYDVWQAV